VEQHIPSWERRHTVDLVSRQSLQLAGPHVPLHAMGDGMGSWTDEVDPAQAMERLDPGTAHSQERTHSTLDQEGPRP
jgi:hypothetical protein